MILAQVDTSQRTITFLSIPRDIFYNGRKINSAYYFYGVDELKRELEAITGVHIDHFAFVDMYAFIEVVDLVGGIDLTLQESVVDPTYKTFDFGKWGTLYFEKGEHHLSGVQALRLARSRHSSSDFERAKRQQEILQALKQKVRSLNASDTATVTRITKAVFERIETDMPLKEALGYFIRFKDYKLKTGFVLSTENVLKSKFIEEPTEEEKKEKCYVQRSGSNQVREIACPPRAIGQYILIPREDWKAVQKFVSKIFNH